MAPPAGFGAQGAEIAEDDKPKATAYGETQATGLEFAGREAVDTRATGITFAERQTVATRATDTSFAHASGYGALASVRFGLVSRFHVKIDKQPYDLGMWSKVDGISVKFDTEDYAELAQHDYMKQLPKRTIYTPVKLTRGIAPGSSSAVLKWLDNTRKKPDPVSMKVTVFDAWVQEVMHWTFRNVVVLSWKAGGFDAGTQKVATEELEVRHEGFLGG